MPKKTTKPKFCKLCEYYTPDPVYKAMKAGKCEKGVDLMSTSGIFDCKENDVCKKFKRKK